MSGHIGEAPLTSGRLAEIADVPVDFLTQDPGENIDTCMDGSGYRKPREGTGFRAMIRSPYPSNRRFHFARLSADDILAGSDESLLPVGAGAGKGRPTAWLSWRQCNELMPSR